MSRVGSETIEMPALGRPFKLGMLYDCRSDKLVPALTLWDHETLKQDMTETPKPNSEFEIVASESISCKSSSLGVESSLKASFFGGLVAVEGSAKYLNDKKTSKQQARVTLQYKTTTKFKELSMNQLGRGNIEHAYVFEKGLATHVVTAILYGAQAFFVFTREVSESENVHDVQGKLQLMIKQIPCIPIGGELGLQMKKEEKETVSKFSCKFHGDFSITQSPVNFEDAVKVYNDLPNMLGPDGEKAVPVKVWLLPLTLLDPGAAKLVRQISVRLVSDVEKTLEYFEDLEMRCYDALRSAEVQRFPQVVTKIKAFMAFCSEFKLGLQGTLAKKLPSIRGGGEEETELAELLKKQIASPFNKECLDQWLRCKLKEVQQMKTFTNMMKNAEVLSSQTELDERICNIKTAVCFVFTSLEREEPFLCALDQYVKGDRSDKATPRGTDIEKDQWYSSKSVRQAVKQRAKLFGDFAEANQDNDEMVFLVVGLKDESHEGSAIYLYEDGFENNKNFEPPTKPNEVKVDEVTHDSVSLSFCGPDCGVEAVTGYRLEHREAGGEWKQQNEANAGSVSVSGLTPDTEYSFRVRAVTDVGLGPAAEVVSTKTSLAPESEVTSPKTSLGPESEVLSSKGHKSKGTLNLAKEFKKLRTSRKVAGDLKSSNDEEPAENKVTDVEPESEVTSPQTSLGSVSEEPESEVTSTQTPSGPESEGPESEATPTPTSPGLESEGPESETTPTKASNKPKSAKHLAKEFKKQCELLTNKKDPKGDPKGSTDEGQAENKETKSETIKRGGVNIFKKDKTGK